MAHKLYFDNVGTSSATLNDGILIEGIDEAPNGVMSFADAATLTNESRATDRDTINAITSWGSANGDNGEKRNDALQFDFGASKAIDFVALFFNAAETDSIRVSHDDAATGAVTLLSNLTADFTTKYNIRSFTQASNRYWYVEATSGTLAGVTEIFFGTALDLPIDGNSITTQVPFSSFKSSTYNNTEFTNKIDTELREWTISLPIITEANKTSLELLQSNYSNLYTFVYYDESAYHTVRLAKPFSFNQIATNTYSTTITLKRITIMAKTIYYDNLGSRSATLTDGTINNGASPAEFTSADALTDEHRANDGGISEVVGGWAVNEGLQFNFGSAVSPNFCAVYSTVATDNEIRVNRDSAASGAFTGIYNDIDSLAVGWNIRTLTELSRQYWTLNSKEGDLTGIAEVFFGKHFELPLEPTANIITKHNFGTEEVKAYGANRYYISKHDNYKTMTLSFNHMTIANKTSLEDFSNIVTDREPFIYSEDGTTGPFHWVRLVRPLTFKTVLPDIFSCQVVMRELTS